jgi:hypothetical protein
MKSLFPLFISLLFLSCSKTTPIPKKTKDQKNDVSKEYINSLNFGEKELLITKIDGEYYYIHKNGKKMQTITYENGPDKFSEGLARTRINGKIGFFNRNLEITLKPLYDFAFPFHNGISEICTGCTEKEEEGTMMLDGGTWKKIDRSGLIIE